MKLVTGDVVFVMHHGSLISKIISWAMGSKWSHSAIVYDNLAGKTLLCETSSFEVTLNWFNRYVSDKNTSIEVLRHHDWVNVISGNEAKIQKSCDSLIGVVYGYTQLISLGLRRLLRLRIGNLFRSGLVCCHVVGYGLHELPGTGFEKVDPESFDTEEMYQWLKRDGWVTIYSKERGE